MTDGEDKGVPEVLTANCVEEEYLYVTMQRCECGGTYEHDSQSLARRNDIPYDELRVRCRDCKRERVFVFDISAFFGDMSKYGVIVQPSQLFDIVEWLGLAALFIRDGQNLGGEEKRIMLAEADFCLDQALMFYDESSDLPRSDAFFHQPGRKIPGDRVALVSRKHVLGLKECTKTARAQRDGEDS